jgi:hypothetical protein
VLPLTFVNGTGMLELAVLKDCLGDGVSAACLAV